VASSVIAKIELRQRRKPDEPDVVFVLRFAEQTARELVRDLGLRRRIRRLVQPSQSRAAGFLPAGASVRQLSRAARTALATIQLRRTLAADGGYTQQALAREERIERRLRRTLKPLATSAGWQAYYNGACYYSLRMGLRPDDRASSVAAALGHLNRAVRDSSRALGPDSPWLLRYDPDLASLRDTWQFREWVADTLGHEIKEKEAIRIVSDLHSSKQTEVLDLVRGRALAWRELVEGPAVAPQAFLAASDSEFEVLVLLQSTANANAPVPEDEIVQRLRENHLDTDRLVVKDLDRRSVAIERSNKGWQELRNSATAAALRLAQEPVPRQMGPHDKNDEDLRIRCQQRLADWTTFEGLLMTYALPGPDR
jgi:hypothetical protein